MTKIYLGDDFNINEKVNNDSFSFLKERDGIYLESDLDKDETLMLLSDILEADISVNENNYVVQNGKETEAKIISSDI